MQNFLLGWAIASTVIAIFAIWLLFKKVSTHNEIDNLKQKNKHNKSSNIDNDITATLDSQKEKKQGAIKRFINKRQTKKEKKKC